MQNSASAQHVKLNAEVTNLIHGMGARGNSMLVRTNEEAPHGNISKQAVGGTETRNTKDNLESSEVGTMYLREGRNSSIGTTTNARNASPNNNGLGLSHYKNASTPLKEHQYTGLPGINHSSNMQSEQKIPTMQEFPLIAKQVKGPSSIQQN